MRQGRNGDRQWSGAGEGQEAHVTPAVTITISWALGSLQPTENPQSPYTQRSFQGARIENNQYPHLLSDI